MHNQSLFADESKVLDRKVSIKKRYGVHLSSKEKNKDKSKQCCHNYLMYNCIICNMYKLCPVVKSILDSLGLKPILSFKIIKTLRLVPRHFAIDLLCYVRGSYYQ